MTPQEIAADILTRANPAQRFIIALAGPPGSGKSTLAGELVQVLRSLGPDIGAKVVPMDGYHYDDAVLIARGLRQRKGAPETFDAMGFSHMMSRLRTEDEVAIPIFDRSLELSRAAGDVITAQDRILVVEGNYLLLNHAPWNAIRYDMTLWLDVPEGELRRRLLDRWAHHGKSPSEAIAWIEGNDLPNIRATRAGSRGAQHSITWAPAE